MRTTPLTDNLIQLTRQRWVNAYLVREDDGYTLIDTTLGGAADDLMAAAQRSGGAIKRIALTHGHGDHVGSLDALKDALGPAVDVLIPDADARILAGDRSPLQGKKKGSWPKTKTAPDERLAGGERIGSLEVVPSPGHTPGHVAFLDTRDRALIAGDVFTSIGGLAVTNHFQLPFPFAWMGTWNPDTDLDSARRLTELDPSLLAVGHGGAVRDPAEKMKRALARAS